MAFRPGSEAASPTQSGGRAYRLCVLAAVAEERALSPRLRKNSDGDSDASDTGANPVGNIVDESSDGIPAVATSPSSKIGTSAAKNVAKELRKQVKKAHKEMVHRRHRYMAGTTGTVAALASGGATLPGSHSVYHPVLETASRMDGISRFRRACRSWMVAPPGVPQAPGAAVDGWGRLVSTVASRGRSRSISSSSCGSRSRSSRSSSCRSSFEAVSPPLWRTDCSRNIDLVGSKLRRGSHRCPRNSIPDSTCSDYPPQEAYGKGDESPLLIGGDVRLLEPSSRPAIGTDGPSPESDVSPGADSLNTQGSFERTTIAVATLLNRAIASVSSALVTCAAGARRKVLKITDFSASLLTNVIGTPPRRAWEDANQQPWLAVLGVIITALILSSAFLTVAAFLAVSAGDGDQLKITPQGALDQKLASRLHPRTALKQKSFGGIVFVFLISLIGGSTLAVCHPLYLCGF